MRIGPDSCFRINLMDSDCYLSLGLAISTDGMAFNKLERRKKNPSNCPLRAQYGILYAGNMVGPGKLDDDEAGQQ